MSERDYTKLYRIQSRVLKTLASDLDGFYLTGGTALGRFYLNNSYIEDLDFFCNSDPLFKKKLVPLEKKLDKEFFIHRQMTITYEDFSRYFIEYGNSILKIEFVNDVPYRCGRPAEYEFGLIDTPLNILTNKLTALIGRDEPKDIFDIYSIASNYSFNWLTVFNESKEKVVLNEIDVEQRIKDFPANLLDHVDWFINPFDFQVFNRILLQIANDFILGRDNSIGKDKPGIETARPMRLIDLGT